MQKVVAGLDDIRLRYSEEFVVETDVALHADILMAYKVRPLKPMALFAMGFTWPIESQRKREEESALDQEVISGIRNVVARSVVAARELIEGENGAVEERWTPVEVVSGRAVNPDAPTREIHIDELDYSDTITRIWNAMLQRFQLQRSPERDGRRNHPATGTRKPRKRGKNVRRSAA